MSDEAENRRQETAEQESHEDSPDKSPHEGATEPQTEGNSDADSKEQSTSPGAATKEVPGGPAWEAEIDVYPLREATEDAKWAVRTVWIWIGFALVAMGFILVLLILGAMHD